MTGSFNSNKNGAGFHLTHGGAGCRLPPMANRGPPKIASKRVLFAADYWETMELLKSRSRRIFPVPAV